MKVLLEKNFVLVKKFWPIVVTFIFICNYMHTLDSMIGISGDAASIWQTIKSYSTGEIVPSYVLYKGFASVYPYNWLYELSKVFGVGEFFFIKLYHAIIFTYVSTIGIPYIIKKISKKETKPYRIMLLSIILFWFWEPSYALSQLMIDLPSLGYFILLVNSVLRIAEGKKNIFSYIFSGLLAGLCLCLSGQYSIAVLLLIVFLLIKSFNKKILKNFKQSAKVLMFLLMFFACLGSVKYTNFIFEKNVTNVLREKGAFIPTGEAWLKMGYLRLMDTYRIATGTELKDNRGYAIEKDFFDPEGKGFDERYALIEKSGVPLTTKQYLCLVSKYPADFAMKYVNRVFVALSPDGGLFKFYPLFVAYSLFFITWIILIKNVKSVKQFFSPNILIVLSFIMAIAAMLVMLVEMRTVMQIQGLIYGFAVLSDDFWNAIKKIGQSIKQIFVEKTFRVLHDIKMPYVFLIYILFMFFCFTHMGTLYEANGINSNTILINFGM